MRRIQLFVRILLAALLIVVLQGHAMAIEEVMLDFSLLTPNVPIDNPIHDDASLLRFNDLYRSSAGLSLSEEERASVQLSLAIPYWTFSFNPSARSPRRVRSSDVRHVAAANDATNFAGQNVLGMRFNFGAGDYPSWVLIQPPYVIPRVQQELISGTTIDFSQRGVIENVSQVQSISVEVYGLNYPHRLSILFEDTDGIVKERFVGYMEFSGWRTLTWENPHYIPPTLDVDGLPIEIPNNKILYPRNLSSIAFRGLRVWKSGSRPVGDFVGYVKEIRMNYDPLPTGASDFDHERVWQVRTQEARNANRSQQIRQGPLRVYEIIDSNINN